MHRADVWKLQCAYQGALVKIEVNGMKRGLLREADILSLCPKAQEVFQASCKARIVSYAQLYGGLMLNSTGGSSLQLLVGNILGTSLIFG